ncbi:MAG: hypothetical protein WCL61_01580 [bacterium]
MADSDGNGGSGGFGSGDDKPERKSGLLARIFGARDNADSPPETLESQARRTFDETKGGHYWQNNTHE